MKPSLRMTFDAGDGEHYTMVVDLDESTARKFRCIKPPIEHEVPFHWIPGRAALDSFEDVVEILQTRELRKNLFTEAGRRLGTLLAERMCDAEGWADISRIEPAKRQLQTGEPHQ